MCYDYRFYLWWKLVNLATSKCPLIIKLQKFPKNKKHTQKSFNHLSPNYYFCLYLPKLNIH